MRVALYVCRVRDRWNMLLSLDLRVDVTWWLEGASGQQVLSWLLLDEALPLSQASWLIEHFEPERGMDQWNEGHWLAYMRRKVEAYDKLSGEQAARKEVAGLALAGKAVMPAAARRAGKSGMAAASRGAGVGGMPDAYPAEGWAQLEQGAALLAELRGRQLLAAEAEALLADTVPQLASWRSAAQLALHGRLSITAALELPTRRRPRGSARSRRPAAGAAALPGSACPALPAAWRRAPTARPASHWAQPCAAAAQRSAFGRAGHGRLPPAAGSPGGGLAQRRARQLLRRWRIWPGLPPLRMGRGACSGP